MSRRRRSTWKRLTLLALVAAGATATVAVAQTGGALPGAALSFYSFALDMPSPGGVPGARHAQAETSDASPATTAGLALANPVERCTRYNSLRLASAQGIRQGRVQEAGDNMAVIGRLKGSTVRMTIAGVAHECRILRIETL